MHDISNSEYFFFGSAAIDEDTNILTQYALYDYITNRFVLTSRFAEPLKTLAILFSSRLHLGVCSLHYADNFEHGLIDNACCSNWGIADRTGIKIAVAVKTLLNNKVFAVKSLAPVDPGPDELIVQNMEYLLAAYEWITSHNYYATDFFKGKGPFMETEIQLVPLVELPMPVSTVTKDMQALTNIIYTEFDFEIAKQKRQELIR